MPSLSPRLWHDRPVAVTPKQSIRIDPPRWQRAITRARRVHRTDGAKLVNAFLEMYGRGEIDGEVSAWLATLTGVEHTHEPDSSSG
jgi:hypothetical protein